MADATETLNPAQLDAVHYLKGPCLVLARGQARRA